MIRDRWLGRADVRAALGRWPIGRRIAGRHVRHLFGLVAGFAETQMLLAAVELGIFDALRDGPKSWDDLTDLPPRGAHALRQALTAMGLIEDRRDGCTGLTIDGLVVASDPGLRAMIRHNRLVYADLADPVAVLRGEGAGGLAAFWPYDGGGGDPAGYVELMAQSQGFIADSLLSCVNFSASRHVMDVGGGDGHFLERLAATQPHLALTLVDLPAVIATRGAGTSRVKAVGVTPNGALPPGADTVTLLRLLHDRDDAAVSALLDRVAAILPPHGRLIIAEPMARDGYDAQTSYFAAYFAAMRSGRLRNPREISALLAAAGLEVRRVSHPSPLVGVIVAAPRKAS